MSGGVAPAGPPTDSGLEDAIVRALAHPERWQRILPGAWATAGRITVDGHLVRLVSLLAAAVGLPSVPHG